MISRTNKRWQRILWLALLLVPAFAGVMGVPASARTQAAPVVPENPYGVNLFLHKEVEIWKIEETLRMVQEANIQWVKQEFPWQEIEFQKGYFYDDKWSKSSWEKFDTIVDLADKYGLKIIARVSHPPDWAKATDGTQPLKDNKDLADFTNALLEHYAGRIQYVQVWNEPNLAAEWVPGKAVDPTGYADMMKTMYPLVKAQHPDAMILSAPLAITLEGPELRGNMNDLDYWNGLYDAGIKDNFDVASANAYGLDQPPDAEPGPKALNFRRVELLRDIMVSKGDQDKSIWLNEYAWNASPESLSEAEKNYWRHVSEETQAQWTVQGVDYAKEYWPWVGVISIWYFRQVGDMSPDKAEYYFRMVNPDFTTVPIYDSVKADAMKYPGPVSEGVTPTPTLVPLEPTMTATVPAAPTETVAPPEVTVTAAVPSETPIVAVTVTGNVVVKTPTVGATASPAKTVTSGPTPAETPRPLPTAEPSNSGVG
ncbi:MAG: hypothetical protein ABIQ44_11055, partial [Chloroflexia bacterium]